MNRISRRSEITAPVCLFRTIGVGLLLFLCLAVEAKEKEPPVFTSRFTHGEQLNYDLYFKWGLLMPKAGMATLTVKNSDSYTGAAWHYQLLFRTVGVMEKAFSMRDTIDCYYSDTPHQLYSSKRTNEGDYYLIDNLAFSYEGKHSIAHSHRYTLRETKVDTLLRVEGYLFDMLGATMYLRAINWNNLSVGDSFPFFVAIGRDRIRAAYRYTGQQIVERGDAKYSTRHFYIDIWDDAFTQKSEAAEVWIGDDENHIPIRIRAKLKIGSAEVYYTSSINLRYPFSCRVVTGKP